MKPFRLVVKERAQNADESVFTVYQGEAEENAQSQFPVCQSVSTATQFATWQRRDRKERKKAGNRRIRSASQVHLRQEVWK